MTHREARRTLGSRSVRRSGVEAKRDKSGTRRKTLKTRVAVLVRRVLAKENAK